MSSACSAAVYAELRRAFMPEESDDDCLELVAAQQRLEQQRAALPRPPAPLGAAILMPRPVSPAGRARRL